MADTAQPDLGRRRGTSSGRQGAALAGCALASAVLTACPATAARLLGTVLRTELRPGEAVHVSLVANAPALAQADGGLVLEVTADGAGTAELRIVPDETTLDVVTAVGRPFTSSVGPRTLFTARSLDPGFALRCGRAETCEFGATIELTSADVPFAVSVRMGLQRFGDSAWWANDPGFDADAFVGVVFD